MPIKKPSLDQIVARFLSNIDRDNENDCWIWKKKTCLYPEFKYCGFGQAIHFSLWLSGNPVKKGTLIGHTCKNRMCVNPFHTFIKAQKLDMDLLDPSMIKRFWKNVKISTPDKCWEWLKKHRNGEKGYGYFLVGRKNGGMIRATHYSLLLSGIIVPRGKGALHKCDNPPCVNPNHLFVGTQQDNNIDAMLKGRKAKSLNPMKVRKIRKLWSTGNYTQTALAKMFGVQQTMIGFVVRNIFWKHVK